MRQGVTAAAALTFCLLCLVQAFGLEAQWDLRIWLAMGHAFREGRTPYVNVGEGLFFVYPPIAVPLLAPLSLLSLRAATIVWLLLKLVALSGLIGIWRRFVEIRGSALEVLYFLFAFGSALTVDLISGNPGMFEQLGIWLGLLALSRGRIVWFCIAIVVVAQLKIAPVLMLLALLALPGKPRWAAFALSAGAFLAILGLQFVIAPEWFAEFVRRSAGVDERGASNPALVAFIRDIIAQPPLAAAATVMAVSGILLLSGRALRRSGPDPGARVMLIAVAYALIAPRFKDYSYVLLLPVGLHLLRRAQATVPLAAAIALPVPHGARALAATGRYLQTYYPLACALLAFTMLLEELSGPERSSDVSGPPLARPRTPDR